MMLPMKNFFCSFLRRISCGRLQMNHKEAIPSTAKQWDLHFCTQVCTWLLFLAPKGNIDWPKLMREEFMQFLLLFIIPQQILQTRGQRMICVYIICLSEKFTQYFLQREAEKGSDNFGFLWQDLAWSDLFPHI